MFIEPNYRGERRGWIEVVCGSMFSGKTEELIRRLKRVRIANLTVEIFKPAIDVRYDRINIISHDTNAIQSTPVDNAGSILLLAQDVEVVGIDEAQFFDEEIVYVCEQLAMRGTRVIVAGLDMDYMGKPFEPMPQLLAVAEFITKTHAICVKCGSTANYSQRTVESESRVEVGASDKYEARCRKCFIPHSDAPTRD